MIQIKKADEQKLHESDKIINGLRTELIEIKKGHEEKLKLEQKLIQYNSHMDALQLTIKKL